MHPLHLTTRLISAAVAVCTTLVVFSGVVSIGEPQRSTLAAKQQHQQPAAPDTTRLAAATPGALPAGE